MLNQCSFIELEYLPEMLEYAVLANTRVYRSHFDLGWGIAGEQVIILCRLMGQQP